MHELAKYYMNGYNRHETPAELKRKLKYLKKYRNSGTVLDYGCGEYGDFIKHINENGFSADGYDPFYSWNPKHEKYDVIALWWVLEHILDPKTKLIELKEHLNKDGFLIIDLERSNLAMWAYTQDIPRHYYCWDVPQIKELLEGAGYEVFDIEFYGNCRGVVSAQWKRFVKNTPIEQIVHEMARQQEEIWLLDRLITVPLSWFNRFKQFMVLYARRKNDSEFNSRRKRFDNTI